MKLYTEYAHDQKAKMQVRSDWMIARLQDGSRVLLDWDGTTATGSDHHTSECHFGLHMDGKAVDGQDLSGRLSDMAAIVLHVYCETDDDQKAAVTGPVKLIFADEASRQLKEVVMPAEKVLQDVGLLPPLQ